MSTSKLVFGFPGVGKTYAFNRARELGLYLYDSDSSKFHWMYDDKGNLMKDEFGDKIAHPAWPQNYVDYIKLVGMEQEVNPDFIFVSTHEEVMNALKDVEMEKYVIAPHLSMKDEFMKRYRERGSDETFIELMNKNWANFVAGTFARAIAADMYVVMIRNGKVQNVIDFIKSGISDPFKEEDNNG